MAKILVVEDDRALNNVLCDKLRRTGHTVITAFDGADGYKSAMDSKPDLILLDVLMPKSDGFTMLAKLRLDEWGHVVPVIVLTNVNVDSAIGQIAQTEPSFFINKTSNLEDVEEKINLLLAKAQPETDSPSFI